MIETRLETAEEGTQRSGPGCAILFIGASGVIDRRAWRQPATHGKKPSDAFSAEGAQRTPGEWLVTPPMKANRDEHQASIQRSGDTQSDFFSLSPRVPGLTSLSRIWRPSIIVFDDDDDGVVDDQADMARFSGGQQGGFRGC